MYSAIEPGDEVFCPCCKKFATAVVIDVGYGVTEAWGVVSDHVDLRTVCNRCEAEEIVRPEDVETDDEVEIE
jgi:hypothetical protein